MTLTGTWKDSPLRINKSILVSEKLSVERGVTYHRTDLHNGRVRADGSRITKWETERHIRDEAETKLADTTYSKARWKIRNQCLYTEVGYICAVSQQDDLQVAIEEARAMCEEFNHKAKFCHIKFRVMLTMVEPDNEGGIEALREALMKHTADIGKALMEFNVKKATNLLILTQPAVDILSGSMKTTLTQVRAEAKALASQIADVIKACDADVQTAIVSPAGQELLNRNRGRWNF